MAGLADVSAIAISVADMTQDAVLTPLTAALAVVIALAANAFLKVILAATSGSRAVALWLAGGLFTMVGTAGAILYIQNPSILN